MRTLIAKLDRRPVGWAGLAAALALVLYLSTLQTAVNGGNNPFTTDVGEIQNALPRWGLIHDTGYPLYSITGSALVTALRGVGVRPAAGASLVSALWAALAAGLLVWLVVELGAPGWAGFLGSLVAAAAASLWVFASVAEVHTLSLVLCLATLICAVRFGRSGRKRDLLLLALFFSQGVVHQRANLLLAAGLAVLIWPQRRALWHDLASAIAVSLAAPLTYLYIPLRLATGVTWLFGSPDTWDGFWSMMLATQTRRDVVWPATLAGWLARGQIAAQAFAFDLPWPLVLAGLLGLFARGPAGKLRERIGLALSAVPYLALTLIIWEGRPSDAQMAAKLPALALVGVGLALLLARLDGAGRSSQARATTKTPATFPALAALGATGCAVLALLLAGWIARTRPFVLSITRDQTAEASIAALDRVTALPGTGPATVVIPWGRDYWAATYEQAYEGRFPGLRLADHNADLPAILQRGDHLLILDDTLNVLPVAWWQDRLGRVYLSNVAPGVVEVATRPRLAPPGGRPPGSPPLGSEPPVLDLQNGLQIQAAQLQWDPGGRLLLSIDWRCARPVKTDYEVAVHVVAHEPPRDRSDILVQADSRHPLHGHYPTSRWAAGQVVHDDYAIQVPPGTRPAAVRVALYVTAPDGTFPTSPWYALPLPSPDR